MMDENRIIAQRLRVTIKGYVIEDMMVIDKVSHESRFVSWWSDE